MNKTKLTNSEINKLLFDIDSHLETKKSLLLLKFPPIKSIIHKLLDVLLISDSYDNEIFEIFIGMKKDWVLVEKAVEVYKLTNRKSLVDIIVKVVKRNSNRHDDGGEFKSVEIFKFLNALIKLGLKELELGHLIGLDLIILLYDACFERMDFYVQDILPIMIYACKHSKNDEFVKEELVKFIKQMVEDHSLLIDDLNALKAELPGYSGLVDKILINS